MPRPGPAPPPRTRTTWSATRRHPTGTTPPVPTDIHVYDAFAPALGEAFGRATSAGRVLYGFVNHEMTTTYLGSTTGLRLRHVQPTGHYGCTGKNAALTESAWVGGATRDFTDVDALAIDETLAQRLAWGTRRVDLPAGRYDTILPPTALADLMIDAYWYAGARTAWEGQSVYSRRPTGTRIGEQITAEGVNLFSDPAYPALAVRAVRAGRHVQQRVVGLRQRSPARAHRLDPRRAAHLAAADPPLRRDDQPAGDSRDRQPGAQRRLRRRARSTTWWPAPSAVSCSPASGTSARSTRRRSCSPGSPATASTWSRTVRSPGSVNNFRFNESPIDLLRRFTHASETVPSFSREWGDDYFSRTATPALRVPDFNMSSVSRGDVSGAFGLQVA